MENLLTRVQEIKLNRVHFAHCEDVTDLLHNARAEIVKELIENLGERALLKITTSAMGERAWEDIYKYPANWWEAVKLRWAPWWLILRHGPPSFWRTQDLSLFPWIVWKVRLWLWGLYWPVRYTRVKFEIDVIYPNLKISLPEHAHRLVYRQFVMPPSWPKGED
ncbi:MAG: hypothetical protein WC356_02425 [Candidatus Micrarchaeia archaeon]|jgi:hypothetical protein